MEHPHFLHHPPRYVPPIHNHSHHHLPPPPPPPNFPDDGGFYSYHLPPPPPPPPPIAHSYRPPIPPPSYNSPQSQFTFLNHHRRPNHNHNHRQDDDQRQQHMSDFRVSDRFQLDDYRPRLNTPEFDDSFPPDASTDRLRLFPDEPSYHHHFRFNNRIQLSPNRTTDRYRQDVDGSSRFRDDFRSGFKHSHAQEHFRGRIDFPGEDDNNFGHFGDHYGGPSRNFDSDNSHVVSSPNRSNRLASNLQDYGGGSYDYTPDSGRFSIDKYENWRWDHGGTTSRDLPNSQIEMENNDSNKDAIRASSARGVPPHDSGKFGNRGNRIVIQETTQPRKQVQKKSALLRIQPAKTCNRNRNVDQHFTSGFFDDLHPSSFRDKDHLLHSEHRNEENREGSPVELDVSFKSNALVAKPIVSPSSKAVVLDRNLTHRTRKIRKVALQSKVEVSGCGAICDTRSEPCPNGTSQSPGNSTMETMVSDVGGNCVVSSGKPSFSARKKKKVATPFSGATSLQLKEKYRKSIIADDLQGFLSAATSNETTETLNNGDSNESSQATILENDSTNADSGRASEPLKQGKRTHETLEYLSSPLRSKIVDDIVFAHNAVHDSHPVSNFDKNELRNDSSFSEVGKVGDLTQQSYYNKLPKLVQNFVVDGSSEAATFGASDADDLSAEEIQINEGSVNVNISIQELNNVSSIHNGFTKEPLKTTVSAVDTISVGRNQLYINQVTALLENSPMEGFPDSIASVKDFAYIDLPNAEETRIDNRAVNAVDSNRDASTCSDKGFTDSQEMIPLTKFGFVNDGSKQSRSDGVIVLHKNVPVHIPSLAKLPIGGNSNVDLGMEAKSMIKRKREANNTQTVLLNSMTVDTSPKCPSTGDILTDGVSSILPDKDLISAEIEVMVSGDGSINACLQPCEDNRSICVGPKETSPRCRKKKKVCAADFSSLMLSGTVSSVSLPSCSDGVTGLLENTVAGGSFEAVGFTGNVSELENETRLPGSGDDLRENISLVMATANYERDTADMESVSREEVVPAASVANVDGMLHMEICKHGIDLEPQAPEFDLRLPTMDVKCNSYLLKKDDLHSASDTHTICGADDDGFTTNFSDGQLDSVPDIPSNMGSPETLSIDSGTHMLDAKLSFGQTSNEKVSEDDRIDETSLHDTNININSEHAVGRDLSKFKETRGFSSKDTKKSIQSLHTIDGESKVAKNQRSSTVLSVSSGHSSSHLIPSKKTAASNRIVKSRTWRRTDNLSAHPFPSKSFQSSHVLPQMQSMGKSEAVQHTSYIRKGNSLLRKPSPVGSVPHSSHVKGSSVYQLNPLDVEETRKNIGLQSRVDATEALSCLRPGGYNVAVERPKTPPLHHSSKLSNFTALPIEELTSSQLAVPSSNGTSESTPEFPKITENMDVGMSSEDALKFSESHENQIALTRNFGGQNVKDEGNMATENLRITYIKKKSNQLVATSSSNDMSVQDVENAQDLSSGAYFKRRKNQLIRKTSGSQKRAVVPDDFMKSDGQRSSKVIPGRSLSERQSCKGLTKTYKHSKFSRVWTLCEALSSRKDSLIHRPMVRPQLFPWKRTTYRKTYMRNPACIFNINSLSNISKKLLSFRKRDTIYTRSGRGYSLRRSKVLSVGGSSLKWSKSIERDSKKANEEATLAVAAAEKKKKEQQNSAAFIISGTNNRNNSSRERIFRIGSVRYKMDPTRRTLQRISEEESSCSAALESGKDVKKSYVPKRLVIGDDEYIRIGNGNKLVRDPKRRTRILASERVRWSLHTARLRLAKKRKYCQFFTRFGKCNKDGGKCPYIHDSSKIAVCTKFLSGACSNPNCKLTHEIIPERMQDCSYFLQGICSNESCPYRHVNVNRNASICEGFLRGYCADGNECRKKHSYVCPVFEATGACPQGSKCKLHHPKNRTKGKKRKSSREQVTQGRYFRFGNIGVIDDCRSPVSEEQCVKDNGDISLLDGRFADYISLDFCDEVVAGETNNPSSEQTAFYEEDPVDAGVEDLDEVIKPVLVMNKRLVITESSPAIDSSSERTGSLVSEESLL